MQNFQVVKDDLENETAKRCMIRQENKISNGIVRMIGFLKSDYNLSPTHKEWIQKFVPNVLDEIEKVQTQKLLGLDFELSDKLQLFVRRILDSFPTSEAAVERGFSKHKAIHSKFRAALDDGIVEKVLFIRENKTAASVADEEIEMEPFDEPDYN